MWVFVCRVNHRRLLTIECMEALALRFPRARFTLRQLMAGVAIIAAILWVVERRERFRRIAQRHGIEMTTICTDLEFYLVACPRQGEAVAERERLTRPLLGFLRYHYEMVDKYERAANRPWLPVASDPPPPPKLTRDDFKALFLRLEGRPYDANPTEPQRAASSDAGVISKTIFN